ncbi:MAG: hypothetical protein Q8N86_01425 [Atribacterota bacterium]|nr:hypothetical protein [Atribacterota bacterium]
MTNKKVNDKQWGVRSCNITKLVKVTLSNMSANADSYIGTMTRPLGIEFAGAVYHLTPRGNAF